MITILILVEIILNISIEYYCLPNSIISNRGLVFIFNF